MTINIKYHIRQHQEYHGSWLDMMWHHHGTYLDTTCDISDISCDISEYIVIYRYTVYPES